MTAGEGALAGRAAVVTGSSRGIGRSVARTLAAEGAAVVVNGREEDAVAAVVAEIRARGGEAIGCPGSVVEPAFARHLVDACVDGFGAIDALVNCAGIAEPPGASILDVAPEAWRQVLDVHLTGTFHTCREAAPRMVAQGRGALVNTSSHSFTGAYGGTAYPAAKGAIQSLTLSIAAELREHGVRANVVCPGARTRLSTGPDYEAHIRQLHERGLLPEIARDASLDPPDAEHVGPLYAWLASDLARGVTGRVFSVSGGYVGVFAPSSETLAAFRDHRRAGPWSVQELSAVLRDGGVGLVDPGGR